MGTAAGTMVSVVICLRSVCVFYLFFCLTVANCHEINPGVLDHRNPFVSDDSDVSHALIGLTANELMVNLRMPPEVTAVLETRRDCPSSTAQKSPRRAAPCANFGSPLSGEDLLQQLTAIGITYDLSVGTMSRDPQILVSLFYFKSAGLPWGAVGARNVLVEHDQLLATATSRREVIAMNFAYFLADRKYKCVKPLAYRAYSSYFRGFVPFADVQCNATRRLIVTGTDILRSRWQTVDLSRARIYQVHLFLAAAGRGLGSGFGHVMLRLVICAPHRTETGPACLSDLSSHVVLSFRAGVDTPLISPWRALRAGYPSMLYAFSLADVLDEYTVIEPRRLTSIPLRLSSDEIEAVVTSAVEYQWIYEGRYNFFTNNCATETLHLLARALPHYANILETSISRPASLEKLLRQEGLLYVFPNTGSDRANALRAGLIFEPQVNALQDNLDFVKGTGVVSYQLTLRQYLSLSAQERRVIFNQLPLLAGEQRLNSAAALLVLEEAASKRLQRLAGNILANALDKQWYDDLDELQDDDRELLKKMRNLASVRLDASDNWPNRYRGLPMDDTVLSAVARAHIYFDVPKIKRELLQYLPKSILAEADQVRENVEALLLEGRRVL